MLHVLLPLAATWHATTVLHARVHMRSRYGNHPILAANGSMDHRLEEERAAVEALRKEVSQLEETLQSQREAAASLEEKTTSPPGSPAQSAEATGDGSSLSAPEDEAKATSPSGVQQYAPSAQKVGEKEDTLDETLIESLLDELRRQYSLVDEASVHATRQVLTQAYTAAWRRQAEEVALSSEQLRELDAVGQFPEMNFSALMEGIGKTQSGLNLDSDIFDVFALIDAIPDTDVDEDSDMAVLPTYGLIDSVSGLRQRRKLLREHADAGCVEYRTFASELYRCNSSFSDAVRVPEVDSETLSELTAAVLTSLLFRGWSDKGKGSEDKGDDTLVEQVLEEDLEEALSMSKSSAKPVLRRFLNLPEREDNGFTPVQLMIISQCFEQNSLSALAIYLAARSLGAINLQKMAELRALPITSRASLERRLGESELSLKQQEIMKAFMVGMGTSILFAILGVVLTWSALSTVFDAVSSSVA